MRNSLNYRIGPPALAAALGLGFLTPLALLQISCNSPAKDKASNQLPEISGVLFADLATPTSPWPVVGTVNTASTWTIPAGSTTYLKASFASVGGTAILMPGNVPIVSNIPMAVSPATTTTYQVTVTDGAGHTTSLSGTLNVIPVPQGEITAPAAVTANQTGLTASVPGIPPNATGTTYAWTATNGTITSATNGPSITFTAGSANADGSSQNMTLTCKVVAPASTPVPLSQTATIPVDAVAPGNFTYSMPNSVYYLGLPIQPEVPSIDGVITTYSVDKDLPAGLTLDTTHGTISGTPSAVSPSTPYVITASNSGGKITSTLYIEVQAQPAVVFEAPAPAKLGPGGTSILAWNTDATVASLVITAVPPDPTLPAVFPLNGTANVSPTQTTVYTLAAIAKDNSVEPALTQTVTVDTTPLAFTTDLTLTPSGLVPFGGGTTLNWVLAGTPNELNLTSPGTAVPITLPTTASSYAVNPVARRQTYQLTATNGGGTVHSQKVNVFAQGLDVLGGFITQGGGTHDGTGTAAQFNVPYNLAVDPSGNLYVPDFNSHIIRVVTPQGAVSTLAGISGVPGTKDGVSGLLAQFNGPRGVAYWFDTVKNQAYLFVAEYTSNSIRKITLDTTTTPPTATMVALFGGTPTATPSYGTTGNAFDSPCAIAIDSGNNMYVAEQFYGDVLKITGLSGAEGNTFVQNGGTIASYAGNRLNDGYVDGPNLNAYFYGISALVMDSSNNIYVSEASGNRVRKITSTTTSTVAGDTSQQGTIYVKSGPAVQGAAAFVDGVAGTSRLNAPGGLALANGTLYIADTKNNAVRALNLSTGYLTTAIGSPTTGTATPGASGSANAQGTSATLFAPQGLVADASGNLYFTESSNNDLRKADTSLNVTTLAGSAVVVGHADGPQGTGTMAINPGLSTNKTMASMAMDSQGNLYVADVYNNAIRRIDPAGVLTTIAGTAGAAAGSGIGTGPNAQFNQPNGLAMDAAGNIYVADTQNSIIRMLTYDTTNKVWNVSTIAGLALATGSTDSTDGTGATARFKYPYGIAVDASGVVYVADTGNAKLRKLVNTAGAWNVTTLTTSGVTLNTPMGLGLDASGNLYVAERYNYFVAQFAAPVAGTWAGKVISGISGAKGFNDGALGTAKLTQPQGLCVDAAGNVYVADTAANTIRKISYNSTTSVWSTSTILGTGVNTVTPPTTAVPLGTSVGPFPGSLIAPQSVFVTPAGHDVFVTTNGGVAQATAVDGQ